MSPQKNAQYKAYSMATHTVAKTRQIVMLYDGAIRFIKQAQTAAGEGRIEDRFRLLVRASEVIVGLQSSIDFEKGGEVAQTLNRFYTNMSVRILSVNFNPKEAVQLCEEIVDELKQMRDVWHSIDSGEAMPVASEAPPAPKPASDGNVTLSA